MNTRNKRQQDILEKKRDLEESRRVTRDKVCTAPKYPGRPEDYTYVVQEHCRPRDRSTTSSSPQRKKRGTVASRRKISLAATNREIKILRRVLDEYGIDYVDSLSNHNVVAFTDSVFSCMVSPRYRLAHPDPMERYRVVMHEMEATAPPGDPDGFTASGVPRRMVLQMVYTHLVASKSAYGE